MRTLQVGLGKRSYPIFIGKGLLAESAALLGAIVGGRRVVIVSNEVVEPLYGEPLRSALRADVASLDSVTLPDGEAFKTLDSLSLVLDKLVAQQVGRDGCLIALGGGVTGDIAGFAAACYQRGMPWVQIPTTLLAQVDSSVGGKTGVNHPGGKNLIGAFHQPAAVLSDLDTLHSLAPRHYRAGLAEVIKYGAICDAPFFVWLEAHMAALDACDPEFVAEAVERCCAIKARVVAEDETERSGRRALLNFGHTFGHGIEKALGYGDWLHGEAVAAGMVMASDMSRRLGWVDAHAATRVRRLLEAAQLPVAPPAIGGDVLLHNMRLDKKARDGRLVLVLLKAIGEAIVTADFEADALHETLTAADATGTP